jgi:cytochrome c peroxidase
MRRHRRVRPSQSKQETHLDKVLEMKRMPLAVLIWVGLLSGLPASQTASKLQVNPALPPVAIPPDNPQSEAKVALGRQLYFDPRLSADNTISCATCHAPQMAWANHNPVDIGIQGRQGTRNSGTILDAAYMDFQFWDGRAKTLEEQALGPIHNPVEMGETLENVVRKLTAIEGYRTQFKAVFGSEVTTDGIAKAIAAFERTVLSGPSPFDTFMAGDKRAMPEAAVRGLRIFNGKARCKTCHGGPMFSDQNFHNLGVGMDRPQPDIGREAVTNDPKDRGRFKTPSLRNVALTWPYMHDGSLRTLEEVVAFYNRGGIPNPTLDIFVMPLELTQAEQKDLVAFLEALTGSLPKIDRPVLPK